MKNPVAEINSQIATGCWSIANAVCLFYGSEFIAGYFHNGGRYSNGSQMW